MARKIDKSSWGVSYGELVWREFCKSRLTMVCLGFIVFLFVMAVFAPFLANDKPLVIRIEGQWHFPIFRSLTASDYSVFLAAAVGVVLVGLIRWNRAHVDPSIRSGRLWRQICVAGTVVVIGVILFFVYVPRRLDATDYKSMIVSGKADIAVFTPVPYGYARTELKVREQGPTKEHWLGTDDVGSDVLCRLIHGSRISLSVGFVAVGISSVIGVFVGAILGYFGGEGGFYRDADCRDYDGGSDVLFDNYDRGVFSEKPF